MTDPHQSATSPGVDQSDIDHRTALAEHLGKEVWPADRDALVAKATSDGAPGAVLGQLQRLPAGQQFQNVQEVAVALGIGTEQHRF
ncbi:DUF2795 domain-containing protein [Modestobacter sp. I12A-02628]|uniref:DUF2795 domain-containing protein n=1 Tax=Goekera deserti TaxID=2497753 RepID=A0A7K3WB21_9ACTN|nr:DUF2795 domain-containing protein [Goekera deserti]MPQ97590.1 DUF2795 domain-containing protein [Goekera deserti]NDI47806.1 DUF2795 domain-containing protein [Goekera deserti]NEL53554.1 DUF2795 domain-containing protein [Goekera deserti]